MFVLIDALGWKLLESHEFLNDVLTYRTPLRTVLGFSSGAIPAILTGLLPSQTGHWNLFYYDPERSPFRWLRYFRFLPNGALDNRLGRKLLKELGRRMLGLGPLFECCVSPRLLPYFNWVEKRNIYATGAISGAASIFDQLQQRGIGYRSYSYHHWTDPEILERVKRDMKSGQEGFFFIYLSEIDHFLHDSWNNDGMIQEKLNWYARQLREIYEQARNIDPGATFAIFSDHGMTPVRSHFDLVAQIDALGLKMPEDYLAVYDSTMARFWFFNEQARRRVEDRLQQVPCGRIIPNDELQGMGIFFPDQRYGEVIFLMNPGWLMAHSDFHGQWMPVGMHGYHPDDPYSDAVFLANRQPPFPVRTIRDVYSCLREAMEDCAR